MVAERKQEAGEKAAGTRAHSFLRQRKENELTIRFPAVIFKLALGLNFKTPGVNPPRRPAAIRKGKKNLIAVGAK